METQTTCSAPPGQVVATASAANADFVRGLGADQVIDYKQQRCVLCQWSAGQLLLECELLVTLAASR